MHCDCMAGLGESCSHAGAILFYVEAAVRMRDSKTVTGEKAHWMLPSAHKATEYKRAVDIDFTSPKTMKAKLDLKVNRSTEATEPEKAKRKKSCFEKYNPPTQYELDDFYANLSSCGSKPGLLSIVPPYSKEYIPKLLQANDYPQVLTELYDPSVVTKCFTELLELCIKMELTISKDQQSAVEKATKMQANSKDWFLFRAGRITASKVYNVCHTDVALPSQSLIKSICYPESYRFSSVATSWGCDHEKIAREMYETDLKDGHKNVVIEDSGLHISIKNPFLGASPDALVACDCCGEGCLEIKCPFCSKDQFIFEAAENKKFCLDKVSNGFQLSKNHPYYYQVQAQIHICGRKYCDFYVWTEKDYHVERILPEPNFWADCIEKCASFFQLCLLPELVGKFYSRETHLKGGDETETCSKEGKAKEVFCYCKQPENSPMIACDNDMCKIAWFHMNCLKLSKAPSRKWY